MRGINLTVCPRAHLLASRSVTKLEIPSNNFENKKRTQTLCYIFELFDYLSPAYPEKPNSGRLNPFRSSTGLSTSIESFQRGKSSNLGRELHERPGKYGR